MLPYNYLDEVLERPMQLLVPTPDLPKLHDAEVEEEGLDLRLQHVENVVVVARPVSQRLQVVELEPK